jgi:hypothetical protein
MQTRKLIVAGAVAAAAVIGFGTAVSANVLDTATGATGGVDTSTLTEATDVDTLPTHGGSKWYWVKDGGSLVAIDDNNVGPFQACHNNGAGSGAGGAVAGSDIIGILGFDNDGNNATVVKTCETDNEQANDGKGKWYKADGNGVVSMSNNNVGPFQACHNNVSVGIFGGAGTVSDVTAILGWDNDKNSSEVLKTCELDSAQHN